MMFEKAEDGMLDSTRAEMSADRDPRWRLVVARDRSADGTFFFSVKSTGVYCRPSCPARRPKPENVAFHLSCEGAERAGYRPCRRCNPDRPETWRQNTDVIAEICRVLEASEVIPSLDDLARRAGYSPHHFHRLFRSVTGVTPREYAKAHRAKRVRERLENGANVTTAVQDAGFGSTSRFYETSDEILGMKPSEYRAGGTNADIRFAFGDSSLGKVLVARTERGICAIFLGDDPDELARELQHRFPRAKLTSGDAEFGALVAKVVSFVETPKLGLDLPLDLQGTAFQQRVWNALRDIPAGKTATYSEIAKKIGAPKSVRAVGAACGANHVSLAVPCHRVVGASGALTGYRWGVERKRKLLDRERE